MITVTALFVLFMLVIYLLKKKKNMKVGSGDKIKVLDRKYLGQKQYLATVIVENEKLLLGVTDQSINLIKTLEYSSNGEQKSEEKNDDINETSFPKILGKLRNNSNEI